MGAWLQFQPFSSFYLLRLKIKRLGRLPPAWMFHVVWAFKFFFLFFNKACGLFLGLEIGFVCVFLRVGLINMSCVMVVFKILLCLYLIFFFKF